MFAEKAVEPFQIHNVMLSFGKQPQPSRIKEVQYSTQNFPA